jgi:hypothetical protein
MGHSVSSEEDLAAVRAAEKKPIQHVAVPNGHDKKRDGRKMLKRSDATGDDSRSAYELSHYDLKNRAKEGLYLGVPAQEFNRVDRLNPRKRVQKLNRSDVSVQFEEMINNNKDKHGRKGPEGEVEPRRGQFRVKPSPGEKPQLRRRSSLGDCSEYPRRHAAPRNLQRSSSFSTPHDVTHHSAPGKSRVSTQLVLVFCFVLLTLYPL